MDLQPGLIFFFGLVTIILGAELVLRGAARLALMMGIKPIIIGLTVVSIGTSMPELAVGITAVSEGMGSLAVGNIAGTNILNILFILGLSAALRPLKLHKQSIKLDVPVMIATSLVLIIMARDGILTRTEGSILVFFAFIYIIVLVRISMKDSARSRRENPVKELGLPPAASGNSMKDWIANTLMLFAGMAFTVMGAEWLVNSAVDIATALGVSQSVIGLTIVAIGTSAPELVTTIVATIRDERDVAVGNLIGSSISNILFILGVTCFVSTGVDISDDILWLDLPLGALVAIACYPVFKSNQMVSRTEGIVFVILYLIYLSLLIFLRT